MEKYYYKRQYTTWTPTNTTDIRRTRNERMRYNTHGELMKKIKNELNKYYSRSDQWMYDEKDIPKYMLLDHLQLLEKLNGHVAKIETKVNEELNKNFF